MRKTGAGVFRFDIENIKLPIRLCPDAKMNEYLYDADDAIAAWIRPEGLSKYEPYAVSCEFKERDLTRQSALLDVYKQGYWKDELNFVINSLNLALKSLCKCRQKKKIFPLGR